MIESKTTYTLSCDDCGEKLTVGRYKDVGEFDREWDAETEAEDQGWQIDGKKHICPDCIVEPEEEEEE